jgi:hypothetical protein
MLSVPFVLSAGLSSDREKRAVMAERLDTGAAFDD